MYRKQFLLVLSMCCSSLLTAWSGGEATSNRPIFFGKLTSQEGNTYNVSNIVIGRSTAGDRSITLYEMPQMPESGTKLTVNPYQDLTTTELDLLKVNKIAVSHPDKRFTWAKPQADTRAPSVVHEFMEIHVTWKNNQTNNYLLELGTENSTRPVKIFCDTSGTKPLEPTSSEGNPEFCKGVPPAELHKKGAPFPSIKELVIEKHCYEPPKNKSAA